MKKSRHYLLCQKFTLYTDHEALKYVINIRDPHGLITRWISIFAEYDFEIKNYPGKKNDNAGYLSRPVEDKVMVISSKKLEKKLECVRTYLSTGKVGTDDAQARKHYLVYEGMLNRRTPAGIRYIPDLCTRSSILIGIHDEIGHWDFKITYKLNAERFWWPKIRPNVALPYVL